MKTESIHFEDRDGRDQLGRRKIEALQQNSCWPQRKDVDYFVMTLIPMMRIYSGGMPRHAGQNQKIIFFASCGLLLCSVDLTKVIQIDDCSRLVKPHSNFIQVQRTRRRVLENCSRPSSLLPLTRSGSIFLGHWRSTGQLSV